GQAVGAGFDYVAVRFYRTDFTTVGTSDGCWLYIKTARFRYSNCRAFGIHGQGHTLLQQQFIDIDDVASFVFHKNFAKQAAKLACLILATLVENGTKENVLVEDIAAHKVPHTETLLALGTTEFRC